MSEPEQLRYVKDDELTIRRERAGKGFRYRDQSGHFVKDDEILARIKGLVIPPAWTAVRICPVANGHLQAVGLDARGRRQYLYHPEWRRQQQQHKFARMVPFGAVLPELRANVRSDMRLKGLSRRRVVATVVWLLENTFVRVGNPEYARANGSYGLTTLREKHVDVDGHTVQFEFVGKGGLRRSVSVTHPRVARTIRQCIELPGYELFQYVDDGGQRHLIESRDVNDYLKEVAGDDFTAKDFRTWGGTVLAGQTLYEIGPFDTKTAARANLVQAVKRVAEHLGNTPTICRQYYVHPAVVETYQSGLLIPHFNRALEQYRSEDVDLSAEEFATWTLLQKFPPDQSDPAEPMGAGQRLGRRP